MKCDWGVPCFCGSGVVNAVSGASVRYRFSLSSSRWGGGRGCMMLRELNVCFLQIVNAEPAPLVLPPLTYVHSSTFLHDGLIYFSLFILFLFFCISAHCYCINLIVQFFSFYASILTFCRAFLVLVVLLKEVSDASMIWIFGVSQIKQSAIRWIEHEESQRRDYM